MTKCFDAGTCSKAAEYFISMFACAKGTVKYKYKYKCGRSK